MSYNDATWTVTLDSNISDILNQIYELRSELDDLVSTKRSISLDLDMEQAESLIGNLDKLLDNLGKGTNDFQSLQNLDKQLAEVLTNLQTLKNAFTDVDSGAFSGLQSVVNKLGESLTTVSSNVQTTLNSGELETLSQVTTILTEIENSMKSLQSVISDVGDGQEFSPLMTMFNNLLTSVNNLKKSISGIGFNINLTSDQINANADLKVQERQIQLLNTYKAEYEELRNYVNKNSIFSSGNEFFKNYSDSFNAVMDFENSTFDNLSQEIAAYKEIINTMQDFSVEHTGENVYSDIVSSYTKQITQAKSNLTRAINAANKSTVVDSGLDNLFGATDLSTIIEQLNKISTILSEISAKMQSGQSTLDVSTLVQNVEQYVNHIKELETTIDNLKSKVSSGSQDTSIKDEKTAYKELSQAVKEYQKLRTKDIKGTATDYEIERANELLSIIQKLSANETGAIFSTDALQKVNNLLLGMSSALSQVENNEALKTETKTFTELTKAVSEYQKLRTKDIQTGDLTDEEITRANELLSIIQKLSANETGAIFSTDKLTEADNLLINLSDHLNQVQEKFYQDAYADNIFSQLKDELLEYETLYNEMLNGTVSLDQLDELRSKWAQIQTIVQDASGSTLFSDESLQKANQMLDDTVDRLQEADERLRSLKETTTDFINSQISNIQFDNGFTESDFIKSDTYSQIQKLVQQLNAGTITTKEFKTQCTSLVNEFAKFVKTGQNIGVVAKTLEEAEEAAHNFSQSGDYAGSTILNQGEWVKASNGVSTMTETIRTADGQVKTLKYTWQDGFITCNDVTKTLTTSTTGLGAAIEALKSKLSVLMTYWTAQLANPYKFIQLIKEAITTINDLDDALVDLQKTTTMSTAELEDFYYEANDVARQMGVTTEEIIEQASAWSRLGYSSQEAATQMAELSSQFASISPGMDTDTAQEGLVSIMKAFDIGVEDVESEIMDKINVLGNNFAETNEDIVTGMEKSAAAMSALGQSFEDTAALFTAGMEILQNAETMGASLRTIALRIRGYDEETEELSDDLVNITGEVVDLTKTASNPEGISLFTDSTQTEYKSMVEYLGEIADIWDEISETNQTELMQKLFGKTRAQAGAAIITNFDTVREALETMEESAGSADAEMGIIEESISYKLNNLQQIWVGVAQTMIDRGGIGTAIDTLASLSEAISALLETAGLIPTVVGAAATAIAKLSGVELIKYDSSTGGITTLIDNIKNLNKVVYNQNALDATSMMDAAGSSLNVYKTNLNELISTYNIHDKQLIKLISDYQNNNLTLAEGATWQSTYKASVDASTAATTAQTTATKLLNISIKALSIVGMMVAFTALTKVIQLGMEAIDDWVHRAEIIAEAAEEAQAAIDDVTESYQEQADLVDEVAERYEELSEGVKRTANSYENVDLSDDEYEEFLEINEELADMFPGLTLCVDDNGNSILNLGLNLQSTTEDLYDFLEAEEAVANYEIASNIDDVADDVAQTFKENIRNQENLQEEIDNYNAVLETLSNFSESFELDTMRIESTGNTMSDSAIRTALENAVNDFRSSLDDIRANNIDWSNLFSYSAYETADGTTAYDFYLNTVGLSEEEIADLQSRIFDQTETVMASYRESLKEAQVEFDSLEAEMTENWASLLDSMGATTSTLANFDALNVNDDELGAAFQDMAITLAGNIDSANWDDVTDDIDDWIYKNILAGLQDIEDSDLSQDVADAYQELLALDTDSLSPVEVQEYVNNFISLINQALENSNYSIDLSSLISSMGFDDVDSLADEYASAISTAASKFSDVSSGLSYEDVLEDLSAFMATNSINTEAEIQSWLEIVDACDSAVEAKLRYLELWDEDEDDALDLSSTMENLEEMEDLLGQLDTTYAKLFDSDDFISTEDYTAIYDAFSDIEDLDISSFIKQLQEAGNDTEAVNAIMEDLIGQYLEYSGILESVTEDNAALITQELEEQGVVNAETIVYDALNGQLEATAIEKSYLTSAGNSLANATLAEISTFWSECEASDAAKYYLAQFLLAKIAANGTTINTVEDIETVIALANAAMASSEAIALLEEAKAALASGEDISADIQSTLDSITSGTFDYNFQLLNAIDYMPEVVSGTNSYTAAQEDAEDATSDTTDAIQDQIDALEEEKDALEDVKDELNELYDAIMWFYDNCLDDLDDQIEAIEALNDLLDDQLDTYDGILAIIESVYDDEIDAIQAKIDALDDANDAAERQLALEEAQYALEQAKNSRTILQYTEDRGYIYTTDETAIKEAEEEVDTANSEIIKAELEEQIDLLEAMKALWAEIPDAYETAMNEAATIAQFGSDYIAFILSSTSADVEDFKTLYVAAQTEMADNDDLISSLEEQEEYIEELKELWEDAKNAYQYSQYEAALSAYFGSDYEYELLQNSATWRQKFADEYADVCQQIADLEEQIAALSEQTAETMTESLSDATDAVSGLGSSLGDSDTLSYYIWTDDDEASLAEAKSMLEELEEAANITIDDWITPDMITPTTDVDALTEAFNSYKSSINDSKDALSAYVDAMGTLKEGRVNVDEVNESLANLQNYDFSDYNNMFDTITERLGDASNYSEELEEYVSGIGMDMSELVDYIGEVVFNTEDLSSQLESYGLSVSDIFTGSAEDISLMQQAMADLGITVDDNTSAWDNLSAGIGSVYNQTTSSANDMQQAMEDMGLTVDSVYDQTTSKVDAMEQEMQEVVNSTDAATASFETYGNTAVTNASSVVDSTGTISESMDNAQTSTEDVNTSLENTGTTAEVVARDQIPLLKTAMDDVSTSTDELDTNTTEMVDSIAASAAASSEQLASLNEEMSALTTNETELETTVNTEVVDATTLMATAQTTIESLNAMIETLNLSLSDLDTALTELNLRLSELDSATFTNVISALGETGLYAAINNVITAISGEGGLISQLSLIDTGTSLAMAIAQFNGDAGLSVAVQDVINLVGVGDQNLTSIITSFDQNTTLENICTQFSNNLVNSIQEVIDIINNELIPAINNISTTVGSIDAVASSFSGITSSANSAMSAVNSLKSSIDSLQDKTVTITTVYNTVGSPSSGVGTGTAKTFGTGTAVNDGKSGKSYAKGTGKWALPRNISDALISELGPELLLRDGEYHLITEPTLIDLKKDDVIFNAAQTAAIMQYGNKTSIDDMSEQSQAVLNAGRIDEELEGLSWLSDPSAIFDEDKFEKFLKGRTFASGTVDNLWDITSALSGMANNIDVPNADTINHNESTIQYVFNGNLSFPNITSGNDAQKLIKELQNLPSAAKQYANKRS